MSPDFRARSRGHLGQPLPARGPDRDDQQRRRPPCGHRHPQAAVGDDPERADDTRAGCGRADVGSDYALWTGSLKRKLTDQLSVEYELRRLTLTPDPDRDSTWIHVLRGSQFFTKDLFLRVFYQINSVIERHNVQATFVCRYLPPFGTIQVVYQRGTAEFGQRSNQGHTLFMKATTVF